MNIDTFLFAGALICFSLGTFGVPAKVSWTPLGLALCVLTVLIP